MAKLNKKPFKFYKPSKLHYKGKGNWRLLDEEGQTSSPDIIKRWDILKDKK